MMIMAIIQKGMIIMIIMRMALKAIIQKGMIIMIIMIAMHRLRSCRFRRMPE